MSKHLRRLTDFIEVEWKFAGNGAVEARLEECCPPVTEAMRATFVPFADARNTTVNSLRRFNLKDFTRILIKSNSRVHNSDNILCRS